MLTVFRKPTFPIGVKNLKQNLTQMRFFSTGPALVVAFDHGMMDGPIPGVDNVHEIPSRILPEIDGILMSTGLLNDIGPELAGKRPSPATIVRINWSTIYCFAWNYHSGHTVPIVSPKQALQAGAEMVLVSLCLQTGSQELDAKNIELFSTMCREAHDLGLTCYRRILPRQRRKHGLRTNSTKKSRSAAEYYTN